MAPNARLVLSVMKRMDELGKVMTIATDHGLLIQHNVRQLTALGAKLELRQKQLLPFFLYPVMDMAIACLN